MSCILYYLVAYRLQRTDTFTLQIAFAALFACYLFLLKIDIKWLLTFSILFRVIFILSVPALSDDFYRFIWDGLLWHNGVHPFSHTPGWFMQPGNELPALSAELFEGLNSKDYYTIYPPFHQLVFWLSTFSFSGNVMEAIVPMRLILIMVDLAFIFFLLKIKTSGRSSQLIGLYALNPLVIIEATGNLHFEGMMTLFLIGSIYFLSARKIGSGTLALAAAIATKLTPVIAGPALMFAASYRNWWKITLFTLAFCGLFFLPLVGTVWWGGQGQSLDLYFRKFEFNASIYYLFREVGFWLKGYNVIASLGPILAISGGVIILFISWSKWVRLPSVYHTVSLAFFVFYLFATTVHPWYIIPLIGLSVFSGYKFPIAWSYTIFWSYIGYTKTGYDVPWTMLILEYLLVLAVFAWETSGRFRTKQGASALTD